MMEGKKLSSREALKYYSHVSTHNPKRLVSLLSCMNHWKVCLTCSPMLHQAK